MHYCLNPLLNTHKWVHWQNSEDQDEVRLKEVFHQDLHHFLVQKQSSEKEIWNYWEITVKPVTPQYMYNGPSKVYNIKQNGRIPCTYAEGGDRGSGSPLKNHKNIGFLCNTGPDPLKNHKATKPAFNVGPSSPGQRNAISMAFPWQAYDPFITVFESSIPSSTKNNKKKHYQIWTPLWQNFLDPLTKRVNKATMAVPTDWLFLCHKLSNKPWKS